MSTKSFNSADELFADMVKPAEETAPETTQEVITEDAPTEEVTEEVENSNQQETEETSSQEEVTETTATEETSSEESTEEEEVISDWDEEVVDNTETADYSFLDKVLDKEIKSKEDIVNEVTSLKQQVSELEQRKASIDEFDNVPDDLKQAVKVAMESGDYLEYLNISSVDYKSLDPAELYKAQARNYFPEGEDGQNQFEDYLLSIGDVEVKMRGQQLQNQLVTEQEASKVNYLNQAKAKKEAKLKELKDATSKLEQITFAGQKFKVSQAQRNRVFEDISSGQLMQNMFGDGKGGFDYNKMASLYFTARNMDKLEKHVSSSIRNKTKREILDETSNTVIKKPSTKPNASSEQKTPMDQFFTELKNRKR